MEDLGIRTKQIAEEVASRLHDKHDRPHDKAFDVVQAALSAVELSVDADGKTQYLLFLSDNEVEGLREQCQTHWDALLLVAEAMAPAAGGEPKTKKRSKKDQKQAIPEEARKAITNVFTQRGAVDVALFGRMLADMPEHNIVAASQVAHALSTHRVSVEFDYYTAVDDLKPDDTQGADMIGTVEFNSACFYRYLNVDTTQLVKNLGGNSTLAHAAVKGLLNAAITAIPTGKQSSMAAHNPPSAVMVVVRKGGPWSLANAFVNPVRPDRQADLVEQSVRGLDRYWSQLTEMYGTDGITGTWICALESEPLESLAGNRAASIPELVSSVMTVVANGE